MRNNIPKEKKKQNSSTDCNNLYTSVYLYKVQDVHLSEHLYTYIHVDVSKKNKKDPF